jgi:type VI secretion system protein ImpL
MTSGIEAVLGYLLFLSGGILGLLLVVGSVLVFDWPWWVGAFLALLLAGLALAGLSLRRLWLRRREQHSARQAGEQDLAQKRARAERETSTLIRLQKEWKIAIDTLRRSQLKKGGNPLYALPWFLMIGAVGSGKSSALDSARLPSPVRANNRPDGIQQTEQCNWWFLERSVVIDCAGRYVMPDNEGKDGDAWQKVLSLLIKYRRREPLNGLVVAVPADLLLEAEVARLEKEGCAIRQRIDELMRAAGVRVPVYLLVTKCDLIPGLGAFCRQLPAQSLDQPMGVINHDQSLDPGAFAGGALHVIVERLKKLRLQLLHMPHPSDAVSELLICPEEFANLEPGLINFTTHAFGANPYQETPLLRGIFFGSSRQEGTPQTKSSGTPGLDATGDALSGTSAGIFLHDFFGSILPADRHPLAPTRRCGEWRTLTGNLGLTSWVVLGTALCGLLSFSFVKNLKTIRGFTHEFSESSALRKDLPTELAALERLSRDIQKVQEQNRNWKLPRFGLTESIQVEKGLQEKFCRLFRDLILTPANRQMAVDLAAITPASPDDLYAHYVVHLVRRINLLKARLQGKGLDALQAKPQPSYHFNPADATGAPEVTTATGAPNPTAAAGAPEAKRTFDTLYLCYLCWRKDTGALGKELAELQSSLRQLVALKGADPHWLAGWIDRRSGLPSVRLKDFWGGSLALSAERSVNPVFTRKGKEALDSLFGELEAALPDPSSVASLKQAVTGWYGSAALQAWREFAVDFSKGAGRLRGASEWQQIAAKMASPQGPYFALFSRMALELQPLVGEAPQPPWLLQVGQFQAARAQGFVRENVTISKATEGGKKILSSIRKNVGQAAGAQRLEVQISTGKACQDYCGALAAITPALGSRSQTFQLTAQTFGEDPATGKSPLRTAAAAAARYQAGMWGAATDPLFSQLLNGPLEFLWSYLRQESATELQTQWEEQVLAATVGMTSQQTIPALLGPDGLAWRFVKGPAAPFLTRSVSGYRAKETLGGAIAFESALFSFMAKGVQAQASVSSMGRPQGFLVGIKGLPTGSNSQARVKPHATRLEIQCGGTSQSLVNNNYPVGKTISWSPDACGDVMFQIEVGDVVLTRHYPGQQGFPDFLKDLQGGRRSFAARDFPGERDALARMGITSMTVNYQFIGSAAILKQASTLSGQAPRSIARCWPAPGRVPEGKQSF